LNRYLANNYWNCPILNYNSIQTNDYPSTNGQCGNPFYHEKSQKKKKNEN